jgi:hypothetical protein
MASFLFEAHDHYNFLDATVAQGLANLGHEVYGFDDNAENYLTPHEGQPYDAVIQCLHNGHLKKRPDTPFILLWGADSGQGAVAVPPPPVNEIEADAYFIRDYRGGFGRNVFAINFGIEDRYYCAHNGNPPKPLADRSIDVIFCGQFNNAPGRKHLMDAVKAEFGGRHNLLIEDRPFTDTEDYWSQWMGAHVIHSPKYFEVLADSKIILSPMGAGPDCGRHWEALASGGVALIQRMPTVMVDPTIQDWRLCGIFQTMDNIVGYVAAILSEPVIFQATADQGFETGQQHHSTAARAAYMLRCLSSLGINP